MDPGTYQLEAGLCLDARRAIWFADERILAVADLHLGYAWAHRHGGQLLPIGIEDDTTARLLELAESYRPREIVLLGDIVHRALSLLPLKKELCRFFDDIGAIATIKLIAGNHDRNLAGLLDECGIRAELALALPVGNHLLVHGDGRTAQRRGEVGTKNSGRIIMGHEHPAITLGDGAVSSVKCPCFLISDRVIVLPAFSRWAAGSSATGPLMSTLAREADFELAVAIVAGKLLPVRLQQKRLARRLG